MNKKELIEKIKNCFSAADFLAMKESILELLEGGKPKSKSKKGE